LYAIGLSLNVGLKNDGADLRDANLVNLAKIAHAQEEGCCPGLYGFDDVWMNGVCCCEYDPYDCCICW